MNKVVVIGLEGADLTFLLDNLEQLPYIKELFKSGIYGDVKKFDPPTSIPIWASLVTGVDPGRLGIYGEYQRKNYKNYQMHKVNSSFLNSSSIWDVLGRKEIQSIILDVPLSYPPKTIKGQFISCNLASDNDVSYTYPESLQGELMREIGSYSFEQMGNDLDDFCKAIKYRFLTARYLLVKKQWNFFMMVESSVEKVQRLFWGHDKLLKYYQSLDNEIGLFLETIPKDTQVMLVSPCGFQESKGGLYLNEWLIQEGYLTLKEQVQTPTKLSKKIIDWDKTRAWSSGGDVGSLWLNVKGRDINGVIPKEKAEYTKNVLIHKLISLTDTFGVPLETKMTKLSKKYTKLMNVSPDLFIYFKNRHSLDTVGIGSIHHDEVMKDNQVIYNQEGFFVFSDGKKKNKDKVKEVNVIDIAPTILRLFGIKPLRAMKGKIFSI